MAKKKNASKAGKKAAPNAGGSEETLVIERLDQFKAIAHPLRQRIFERLALGAHTAKQVAQQLGEKPARLYYHVATLERAGLIRLVRTRPNRGATEKYYRAAGRRIEIDPSVFGDPKAASFALAGGGIVDGILTNLRSDLASLIAEGAAAPSGDDEPIVAQLEVHGDREKIAELRSRLDAFLAGLQEESDGDDAPVAERRRLVIAWYPPPTER